MHTHSDEATDQLNDSKDEQHDIYSGSHNSRENLQNCTSGNHLDSPSDINNTEETDVCRTNLANSTQEQNSAKSNGHCMNTSNQRKSDSGHEEEALVETPTHDPSSDTSQEMQVVLIDETNSFDPSVHRGSRVKFSPSTRSANSESGSARQSFQSKVGHFISTKLFCNHPGIFLALSFGLLSSLTSVQVKELREYSPFLLTFYRNAIRLLVTLPFMIHFKLNPFPRQYMVTLCIRSVLAVFTGVLRIFAFQTLPIADATVIMYTYPVIVYLLASIMLKEPCGGFHILTCIVSFAGVTFICQPTVLFGNENTQLDLIGVAYGLGSSLIGSIAFILTKKIGNDISFNVISFNQVSLGTLLTLAFVLGLDEFQWPKNMQDWFLVLGISLFAHLYYFVNYKALQLENAGLVGIVRTIEVPLTYAWQVAFYRETPVALQIIGILLVMLSTFLILLYKWLQSWKEDSEAKKKVQAVVEKISFRRKKNRPT